MLAGGSELGSKKSGDTVPRILQPAVREPQYVALLVRVRFFLPEAQQYTATPVTVLLKASPATYLLYCRVGEVACSSLEMEM